MKQKQYKCKQDLINSYDLDCNIFAKFFNNLI